MKITRHIPVPLAMTLALFLTVSPTAAGCGSKKNEGKTEKKAETRKQEKPDQNSPRMRQAADAALEDLFAKLPKVQIPGMKQVGARKVMSTFQMHYRSQKGKHIRVDLVISKCQHPVLCKTSDLNSVIQQEKKLPHYFLHMTKGFRENPHKVQEGAVVDINGKKALEFFWLAFTVKKTKFGTSRFMTDSLYVYLKTDNNLLVQIAVHGSIPHTARPTNLEQFKAAAPSKGDLEKTARTVAGLFLPLLSSAKTH